MQELPEYKMKPIGIIHTPYQSTEECPKGGYHNKGVPGTIELYPDLKDGLLDLEGFSHLILVWVFHQSQSYSLRSTPPHDGREHGVFATRSPHRPNPVGLTVVKLKKIEGNRIEIEDPDMLDGTPLLDIKPYLLPPDSLGEVRRGWLDDK